MNGDIDTAVEQAFLDLLGEEAFATNFCQNTVLHLVARGPDHHDFDFQSFML